MIALVVGQEKRVGASTSVLPGYPDQSPYAGRSVAAQAAPWILGVPKTLVLGTNPARRVRRTPHIFDIAVPQEYIGKLETNRAKTPNPEEAPGAGDPISDLVGPWGESLFSSVGLNSFGPNPTANLVGAEEGGGWWCPKGIRAASTVDLAGGRDVRLTSFFTSFFKLTRRLALALAS
jgi:hypothetical protein